jgi:CrcB protein
MNSALLVAAGGAIGATARYGAGIVIGRVLGNAFPFGTLMINVVGSCAMGVLIGLLAQFMPPWQSEARLFIAMGLLGGFTTFSSFSLDTIALIERGAWLPAGLYVLASVVLSIVGLYVGLLVTRGSGA